MLWLKCGLLFLITFVYFDPVQGTDEKIVDDINYLKKQIDMIKTLHVQDLYQLRAEMEIFKEQVRQDGVPCKKEHATDPRRDEQLDLMELRAEVADIRIILNNFTIENAVQQAARDEKKHAIDKDDSSLVKVVHMQGIRVEHVENQILQLRTETQQLRDLLIDVKGRLSKLSKEIKSTVTEEMSLPSYNDVLDSPEEEAWERHAHRLRHHKVTASLVFRVAHTQDRLDERQKTMQAQILDLQRRVDQYQEPNFNLLSAKVDMLELETKVLRSQLSNTSQKISDFDKVHASMLELREDVESIENKADKTIPEIRKEISKLDINYAQLTAASSYLKEDQENLRQSVKAIAVSVSNAIDRAEMDRLALHRLNDSIADLDSRAKQHFYRLNDHILKSETNHDANQTETIPLPELMGEVKELQPVESEYQDLVRQLPRDCSAVTGPPGVYLLRLERVPRDAWCDAGATLLQRRYNGSVDFNRKFNEYVHGFGDPAGEYWLGLEAAHRLTADNCSSMRIDMTDIYGASWYAQYERFAVGNADSGYQLEMSGFKGNASDAFEYQNHMEFSAVDRDRDISNTHCAANYEGGWWYSHCQHVNINGKYTLGLTWFDSARNEWIAVASSEVRLYRRPDCP